MAAFAGRDSYPRSDGGAVRMSAHAFDHDPVVLVPTIIAQQRWWTIQIVDHDVDVAIVIEVAERATPA